VCLHPSKGATALQDTSALTKSPIFNQLLPEFGTHSLEIASHGTHLPSTAAAPERQYLASLRSGLWDPWQTIKPLPTRRIVRRHHLRA
jgi:hypothetical protein